MSVDIIIVSYNTCELLRACLQSVLEAGGETSGVRAIVVDNASHDGSPEMVAAEFPDAQLIRLSENIGFGPGNNRGLAVATAEYVLLLNSDAQLTSGALPALMAYLKARPNCVAVGPRLVFPGGAFQSSCRRFPNPIRNFWNLSGFQARFPNRFRVLQNFMTEAEHVSGMSVDMVSGACFLARRDFLESVGRFDENLFMYEEETDVFLPARRRGLEVGFCGEAVVIHGKGSSVEQNDLREFSLFHACRSKYYCFRKHYGAWAARVAWWSDRAILDTSALVAKLRGKQHPAAARLAIYRRAFRESFLPLRGRPTR
ncbi:MAG: glycosyltransferase family 2 protein [Candidatus Hydrogenedentes bacterium]|nr:glycosyltransferase family 2 protein [Candidatus Hydrogenedentota bacterium]